MPIVNYVREHTRFIQYASDEHVPANERILWYALMHIMNQRAQGNVWPDEFIRINNDLLLSYCTMRYDTMATARNGLKQRGLIDFEPGKKNVKSPAYRMMYFYPEYAPPDTERYDIPYPKNSDNIGGNIRGNIGGNIRGNIGGNKPNNIINYTKDNHSVEDDEDHDNNIPRAREEVAAAWTACFGTKPAPYIVAELAGMAVKTFRFAPGVIETAIRIAAMSNAGSPADYVTSLFRDWHFYNLRTQEDVEEYLAMRDISNGKTPGYGITQSEARAEMEKRIRQPE